MYKSESILKKKTHKIPWNFEKQTDHPLLARRHNLLWIKKMKITCHQVDFSVLTEQ